MSNIEPLLHWIPASAGMTVWRNCGTCPGPRSRVRRNDKVGSVMPDLISPPCEVTLIFYFTRACPVKSCSALYLTGPALDLIRGESEMNLVFS